MNLRHELEQIAASAPVADVPADTFARGRRARRRDLGLVVAASVAVLALVAGTALWLPPRLGPPPVADDGSTLGVPDHLYAVPSRAETQEGLVTGPAAAAWITDDGQPVVVDAATGAYHLLPLTDGLSKFQLMPYDDGSQPVTLTPDGARLAYGYQAARCGDTSCDTGIRIVDLVAGTADEIPLTQAGGVQIHTVAWSPDGRWLVWSGRTSTTWSDDGPDIGRRGATWVAGRISPRATTSQPVPAMANSHGVRYAVSDRGEVGIAGDRSITRWDGRSTLTVDAPSAAMRQAPVGAGYVGDSLMTLRDVGKGSYQVIEYPETDLSADAAPSREHPVSPETVDHPLSRAVWLDDSRLLALSGSYLSGSAASGNFTATLSHLAVVGYGGSEAFEFVVELVGSEEGVVGTTSIATDLITVDRPTVSRPAPDWPWTTERKVAVIGFAALGGAALLLALLLYRASARTRVAVPGAEAIGAAFVTILLMLAWQVVTGRSAVFGNAVFGVWLATVCVVLGAGVVARRRPALRPLATGAGVGISALAAAELLVVAVALLFFWR